MRRRSGAGGEPIKTRRRKAATLKRRNTPKSARGRSSSVTGQETTVARLTRELHEALEQRTATTDVLKAISRSTFDLTTVLNVLVELAARLCKADKAQILLPSRSPHSLHSAASFGYSAEYNEYLRTITFPPGREGVVGRVLLEHKPVQIADVLADPDYHLREVQRLGQFRTHLGLPLLREGNSIGVLLVSRVTVRPFDDKHFELLTTFADQAVIAIENTRLLNELRQRTTDLTEALEQQTATSDVLQIISSSPGDLQPVFETMLEKAVRICDAKFGNIFRWDGEALHLVATHNIPPAFAEFRRRSPFRPGAKNPIGRMLATKTVVHVANLAAEQPYLEQRDPAAVAAVELGGVRTFVAVPMLKENELIGALVVFRQEVRPFTNKQIELVKNFAAQAVIAIENTRLLNELRHRTTDLTESLEQQTATSEVLSVISRSPGELEPVFETMLANATRLCEAPFGGLFLRDAGVLRLVASHVPPSAPAVIFHRGSELVLSDNPTHPLARMVDSKEVTHIVDMRTDQSYIERNARIVAFVESVGARTVLCVPMLKDNDYVGAFIIFRQELRPFTDKQIALVQNFASQAVIAIENTRLLNELRELLEQQTATSEVLSVISSSPGELGPVFQAMLENAVRICDAKFGNIYRAEGDGLRIVATHNTPSVFAEARRSSAYFNPGPKNPVRRMMTTKAVVHVTDVAATDAYAEREPAAVASVELGGTRTLLIVPMLKDNELVGAFMLARQEVRPFTDKQIELVTTFADQAVIAVENARLLTELRELLQQQTATANVLKVISRSTFDLQVVLDTLVEFCGAAVRS